jgi:hypothetical protein
VSLRRNPQNVLEFLSDPVSVIFLITRVAEQSIMSVDVEELEDLRYELKGA